MGLFNTGKNALQGMGTAGAMGTNSVMGGIGQASIGGAAQSAMSDMQSSANDAVANNARIAAMSANTNAEIAATNMELTNTNTAIHQAQDAIQTAAKIANAGADGAKEAA